jgi:hypothetical protein
MVPLVREALQAVDPNLPLLQPQTLSARIAQTVTAAGSRWCCSAPLRPLALLLASLGVYSVMAHLVAFAPARSASAWLSVRRPVRVMRMVLGHSRRLTLVGIAIGIGAAFAVSRLMEQVLFSRCRGPASYIVVAATLLLVAEFASWLPARRATRIDPWWRYEWSEGVGSLAPTLRHPAPLVTAA